MTAADRREEYRYDAAGRLAERLVFEKQEGSGKGEEENRTGDAGRTDAGRTDVTKTDAGYAGSGSTGNASYFIHMDTQRCEGSIEKSLAGSLGHAEPGNTGRLGEVVCPTELVLSASYQYSYDRQGNTLSDGENQYRYDSLNRLTEIETQNGDLQKNRYDVEGLRAELEENGELTRFLYSGRDVVAEQDEKNNTVRYVRGLELLSSDCECARTYYHYASDELGSITHVTDENRTVLNRYVYDAFGNRMVKEETVQNRFGFTGEICDGLTGQYYLRARFYNPVIERFLNEDTYYGDGLNLYSYCRNNPVRYVDPSGHWCEGKEGRRVFEGRGETIVGTENGLIINTSKCEMGLGERKPLSSLNKRQRELLGQLKSPGDTAIIRKKSVSMNDLRQLTNVTGDEFNMFTKGGKRLIIRGDGNVIKVSEKMLDDLINGAYGKFSGHTHPPGYSLEPGPADEPFWGRLGQERSSVWGNSGEGWMPFGDVPWSTTIVREQIRREKMAKFYEYQ